MPSSGEMKMNAAVLMMPGASSGCGAGLDQRGADHAADERVRRARRNAVVPGDEVPGDGADQRAEDQAVVDERGIDDALADGGGHATGGRPHRRAR